jgi:CBS domain-containing protein
MDIGTICRREVVSIDAAEGLIQAARLMRLRHVGFLVVVEANSSNKDLKVIGVLTDRDIVTAVIAKDADARTLKVGDVMTRNPLLAIEAGSLDATVRQMREVGVRRVPVVGARNELIGVLSLDDVLEATAALIGDIAGAIRSEQRTERTSRP